jgi:shikimate kinase
MILKLKRTPAIYLVGFMGSGKSSVGRVLAEELGWNFIDLDEDIEKSAGAAISDIFETQGEPAFRALETQALKKRVEDVCSGCPQVISVGGGAFTIAENVELASNHGVTVWLDCAYDVIERRVASETHRPLARDPARMKKLFDQRRDAYARADYRIETGEDDPAAIVSRILALPLFHT